MVGLLDNMNEKMTLDFKEAGDSIYLVGQSRNDINSSEYLHKIMGAEFSPAPYFNLDEEYNMQQSVMSLIKNKLIVSAHDISEGGLFVCLLESAFCRELGFEVIQNEHGTRRDAWWFGESQGRVIVSVNESRHKAFVDFMEQQEVPFSELGKVAANDILVDNENWGRVTEWKNKYDNAIGDLLKGETQEEALFAI
jgi:phosphoribosylformylglycinamidine synthase